MIINDPCYARCPACGSNQAKREYDKWGKEFIKNKINMLGANDSLRYAKETKATAEIERYTKLLDEAKAKLDATPCVPRIKNTCLCCGYSYDTKPLNAQ